MSVPLTELPDNARLWVFGADRRLSDPERAALETDLLDFVDGWTAHGAMLRASAAVIESRFAVVAVDESSAPASGCSIDAMVHRLAGLERRLGCSLLDGTRIFYRGADTGIETCDRGTFRVLIREGAITESTPVFDLTLETVGELRTDGLERPLSRSWHRGLADGKDRRS